MMIIMNTHTSKTSYRRTLRRSYYTHITRELYSFFFVHQKTRCRSFYKYIIRVSRARVKYFFCVILCDDRPNERCKTVLIAQCFIRIEMAVIVRASRVWCSFWGIDGDLEEFLVEVIWKENRKKNRGKSSRNARVTRVRKTQKWEMSVKFCLFYP